jgi:predicted ATPase
MHYLLPPKVEVDYVDLVHRLRDLTYLTAERIGPREVYSLEDPNTTTTVGAQGESALSVLYWGRDERVLGGLAIGDAPPTRLHQVEAHMREFFPGCSLDMQQVPQANGVTLGIRCSNSTDFHRPVNMGFGLTQVFPIIVAAMSVKPRALLLIENPEVHLHPAGQARMGAFLSNVACAGIQVIIETHSDHILSGIRRSVKGSIISPQQVALHFFRSRDGDRDGDRGQVVSPMIDENGNVDVWPDGFFDQFDKDMSFFAGWGQ